MKKDDIQKSINIFESILNKNTKVESIDEGMYRVVYSYTPKGGAKHIDISAPSAADAEEKAYRIIQGQEFPTPEEFFIDMGHVRELETESNRSTSTFVTARS